MSIEVAIILLFLCLFVSIAIGVPFAFSLGGVGILFIYFAWNPSSIYLIASQGFIRFSNFSFLAIPLFIFMANVLQNSLLAEDMFTMMEKWLGFLHGGLLIGTVLICTAFAAMTGVSGASTISMGLIALPAMLKRGYQKEISIGCVAAGGALGILIPPSITMIIYGIIAKQSVGKLFAGGLFPGLVLSSLFILYIIIRARFQPSLAPSILPEERAGWGEKVVSLRAVGMPVFLIVAVLGSIFGGLCSISEAAAMGALGAVISAVVYRRLSWQVIKKSCLATLALSSMVMWIILGATAFSVFFSAIGASHIIRGIIAELEVNRWVIVITMQAILILLGMMMDTTAIIMVTVPIFVPIIVALGFDKVWWGVLFIVNTEAAFLTPPFGYNLFYMKAIVPKGINMGDIYRSVVPFVFLQLTGLAICMVFPQIITWLPSVIFGY